MKKESAAFDVRKRLVCINTFVCNQHDKDNSTEYTAHATSLYGIIDVEYTLAGETMTIDIGLPEVSLGVLLFAALQYLASLWISERLKTSLQKEHSQFLEDLKWELKVREQAVRVAEYLSLATTLKKDSPESDYRKANQLNWELAMWLPEEIYKKLACATTSSTIENSVVTVLSVRDALLKEKAGTLTKQDITYHAPGIGNKC